MTRWQLTSGRTLVSDELCELDDVSDAPAAKERPALALNERRVGPRPWREG